MLANGVALATLGSLRWEEKQQEVCRLVFRKTAEEKYFPSENDCRRQHLSQLTEFYYSELVLTPELKKFQRHVLSNVDSMKQISVASFSSKINPFCKCCQCYMSLLCPPFRLYGGCMEAGSPLKPSFCIHINLHPPLSSSNFVLPSSSLPLRSTATRLLAPLGCHNTVHIT